VASRGRTARFTAVVGDATRAIEVTALDDGRFEVIVDDRTRVVDARPTGAASWSLVIDHVVTDVSVVARGDAHAVEIGGRTHRFQLLDERRMRSGGLAKGGGSGEVRAVMPGKVLALLVEAGAEVEPGQGLLVIEAMKMENEIAAPRAGTVKEIKVAPGQAVESGELLVVVE
jgi:biotin carboxyl carrier protein